jgi:hypothetical protein
MIDERMVASLAGLMAENERLQHELGARTRSG